jgi:hypothetical protein
VKTGRRILAVSTEAVRRITLLAVLYRVTGESKYLDRATDEMRAIAAFPDWNPSHFLDVAEMTAALAIGYDWLHDQLPPDVRTEIRTAIRDKGLLPSFAEGTHGATEVVNNWNSVCNGGLTLGALAIAEDEPDLARRAVTRAITNIPKALAQYEPAGIYPEGPAYWTYGTTYNVVLLAALRSALGSDFGLLKGAPGFRATPQFIRWVYGSSDLAFNYSDNPETRRAVLAPMFWFARNLHDPSLAATDEALLTRPDPKTSPKPGDRFDPLILVWRKGPPPSADATPPLAWSAGGPNPIAFFRSSWSDPKALYLGIKAGSPAVNHAHMDSGSFFLDADGVRWAADPGRRDYNTLESAGVKYWDMRQDSDRWKVFEAGPFGHNLVTIDGQLPNATAETAIIRFSSDGPQPHAVLDLTSSLSPYARRAIRGFALLPGRRVLIQDDLEGVAKGAQIRWTLFTSAEIKIDGSRATLTQNGKSATLEFLSPAHVELSTDPLTTNHPPWQVPIKDRRLLVARVTPGDSPLTRLAVVFTPGTTAAPPDPIPLTPPESWSPALH